LKWPCLAGYEVAADNANPIGGRDPSGTDTLGELMLTVWDVGIQTMIAYPRIATAVRVGFAAINLFAFATSEDYRFSLLSAGPEVAAATLVEDAFSVIGTASKIVEFAPGYVASQGVFGRVSDVVRGAAVRIQESYPGSVVGVRGSLARGARYDNESKALAPFDKSSWDVDAFIVNDQLAAKIGLDKRVRVSSELGAEQAQINAALAELPGYRSGFFFRVFTTQEWVTKYSKEPFKNL
jgi:hypothetical protein